MKYRSKFKLAFFLVLLAALALPATGMAKELLDDRVVAGGSFTLESGETQDGNLIVFAGTVSLEDGSTVNGDIVLMGGTLSIDGQVNGNVVGIGGVVTLLPNADVRGDLTTMAASLNREEGSRVEGQVVTGFLAGPVIRGPGDFQVPQMPNIEIRTPVAWDGLWFLFRTFLWAALAVLLVMFLPNPTERVAETILRQPVLTGAVGLLTAVVVPILLIAIAITIILIPVSLVGGIVLVVAWFFGRIALGFEIGRRLAVSMNQDWPLAVAAGIGTFVLTLVIDGIGILIPCVGWLVPALVGFLGLGGVLLTRFGAQTYPPYPGLGSGPSIPPAPRVPPVPPDSTTGPEYQGDTGKETGLAAEEPSPGLQTKTEEEEGAL